MKKYKQTKTVYAEQWFPPEDPRHVPIEGMVKIPRHVVVEHSDWERGWQPKWELQDTWVYWGGRSDCDFHPIYLCIEPGWWIVHEGLGVSVVEWFGFDLDTEEELE